MVYYEVTVYTGDCDEATSFNDVFIKLVGEEGRSERQMLKNPELPSPFNERQESSFTVSCDKFLGKLVAIELDKQASELFPVDRWFLDKVEVKCEDGQYSFPIYSWITDSDEHCYIEGTARKGSASNLAGSDMKTKMITEYLVDKRQKELNQRKNTFCWSEYKEGLPYCMIAKDLLSLPVEVQFSYTKYRGLNYIEALSELKIQGLVDKNEAWTEFDQIYKVFFCRSTRPSVYVQKNWMDDAFFGYQFLNGINPLMIQRCTALPSNFPVTDSMVFLNGHSLAEEMKNGNIFLCDYKNLDGLKPNTINGKEQYLMAPLVLLHKTADDKMMPIAIQLKQTPGEDNPIFLPTDSVYDWLLAKIFVRSAEFQEHQLNSHLLRTHLLAEVFAMSLLRNVSRMSPLFKLLVPHTRYTLHINVFARLRLISDTGLFTLYAASGGEARITILKRSLSSLTYSSLCIRENITERGLESVPNFYYRDDGIRLWDIIHRFVQGILQYYYKNDKEVQEDPELQAWIGDIFKYGFLSNENTGIPQKFTTVDELVKFVTMVIFTCSAQHSAVNNGQYDYGAWMPNAPISLQCPPPTKKGNSNESTILKTLPDVSGTVRGMATIWLLSKQSSDFGRLGKYREKYFTEATPHTLIKAFQDDLEKLSKDIKKRNEKLPNPYTYMDPAAMGNSVAI